MFGITLAAIVTAALILPGIIGLSVFFASVGTSEVRLSPPPLGAVASVAMAGGLAVAVHLLWAGLLSINAALPPLVPLPPADPYRLVLSDAARSRPVDLFTALAGLSGTMLLGALAGRLLALGRPGWRGRWLFGWLYPILEKAAPADTYINAYVLTRIEQGEDRLGYEGPVDNIVLDETRQIAGLTLRDATPFRMRLRRGRWTRLAAGIEPLPRIVLRGEELHNVVLLPVRDPQGGMI